MVGGIVAGIVRSKRDDAIKKYDNALDGMRARETFVFQTISHLSQLLSMRLIAHTAAFVKTNYGYGRVKIQGQVLREKAGHVKRMRTARLNPGFYIKFKCFSQCCRETSYQFFMG
jgi:hypothetical protein